MRGSELWKLIEFNEHDKSVLDVWDFDVHAHYLLQHIQSEIDQIKFMKKTEEIRWNYIAKDTIPITEALQQLNKEYFKITGDKSFIGKIANVCCLLEGEDDYEWLFNQ